MLLSYLMHNTRFLKIVQMASFSLEIPRNGSRNAAMFPVHIRIHLPRELCALILLMPILYIMLQH